MDYIPIDFLTILFVIIFFTILQSLFGVGLLVFGTPTLLLLDYNFYQTLSYLLPASVAVSLLQMRNGWLQIKFYKKAVIQYMLPAVVLGLFFVIYSSNLKINLLIGIMLLLTFTIRFSDAINKKLEIILADNFRLGFLLTGFIHGLTNLGGASLVIITNALYKDKKEIQSNISYAYFFMALSQLMVLLITSNFIFSSYALILPLVSGIIYSYIGNYIFNLSSEKFYFNLMSFFILVYGILLILK